jgi:pantoate--beta-alanine ligase
MKVIKKNKDYIELLKGYEGKSIGVAPTMGNIHKAHLSLLERALKENDIGIITIFVNPTQFGEGEDFESYPRTFQDDLDKIAGLDSHDKELIVYAPTSEEIYPKDFNNYLKANEIAKDLEGAIRPTHFDGVITVVSRLFEILKPNRAYFGKKDYQQLKLIELMAKEYHPQVEVIGMPIIRDNSGLALSSRNNYLSEDEKCEALKLKQKLEELKTLLLNSSDLQLINEKIQSTLKEDQRFNYLSLKNKNTFQNPREANEEIVILGNFQLGTTRLLDNIEVQ